MEIAGRQWLAFLRVALLGPGALRSRGCSPRGLSLRDTAVLGTWTGRRPTQPGPPSVVKKARSRCVSAGGGVGVHSDSRKTLFSWFTSVAARSLGGRSSSEITPTRVARGGEILGKPPFLGNASSEKRKPASPTCSPRSPLTEREGGVLTPPREAVLGSPAPQRTPKILF